MKPIEIFRGHVKNLIDACFNAQQASRHLFRTGALNLAQAALFESLYNTALDANRALQQTVNPPIDT